MSGEAIQKGQGGTTSEWGWSVRHGERHPPLRLSEAGQKPTNVLVIRGNGEVSLVATEQGPKRGSHLRNRDSGEFVPVFLGDSKLECMSWLL